VGTTIPQAELLDADARDLLTLAATVIADRVCWARDVRAAQRWKRASRKPVHMAQSRQHPDGYRRISCSPRDRRATEWTVIGALELVADYPDGPEVVRAIDMFIAAARGWTPSRVEECGHTWALWTLAVAATRSPALTLAPRRESPLYAASLPREVDLTDEPAPATVRSSGLRCGADAAA